MSSPDHGESKTSDEVDQSNTVDNDAKALDLKNQGNEQLKIGHFFKYTW